MEGGELARRRVPRSELVYGSEVENGRVEQLLERLIAARLVVQGQEGEEEPYVEPAHDALVRGWDKLLRWKKEEQENLVLQRLLTPASRAWEQTKRNQDLWEKNSRLATLREISFKGSSWLNQLELDFVEKSWKIKRRNQRFIQASAVGFAAFATGAIFISNTLRISANNSAKEATRQEELALANADEATKQRENAENNAARAEVNAAEAEAEAKRANEQTKLAEDNLAEAQRQEQIAEEQAEIAQDNAAEAKRQTGIARQEANRANAQTNIAEKQRELAEQRQKEAEDARNAEVEQRQIAEKQTQIATEERDNAEVVANSLLSDELFSSDLQIESLVAALRTAKNILSIGEVNLRANTKIRATSTLNKIIYSIRESTIVKAHKGAASAVKFIQGKDFWVSGGSSGNLNIWDLSGKLLNSIEAHNSNLKEAKPFPTIHSVDINKEGDFILTSSADRTVKMWNAKGELLLTMNHTENVYDAQFSPDGSMIVTSDGNGWLVVWNIDGEKIRQWRAHEGGIKGIDISPDNQYIATASWGEEASARVWSVMGKLIRDFPHDSSVYSVSFNEDSSLLATGGHDGIKVWNLLEGQNKLAITSIGDIVDAVEFTQGEQDYVVAAAGGSVSLWDFQGKKISSFGSRNGEVQDLIYEPQSKKIIYSTGLGEVKFWNSEIEGKMSLEDHVDSVLSVDFDPRGQLIATSGRDGRLKIWNIKNYRLMYDIAAHRYDINHVRFSVDGGVIVTASSDGIARVWSREGEKLHSFEDDHPYRGFREADFSTSGDFIALGSINGSIRLWNFIENSIRLIGKVDSSNAVESLSIHPNGQIVASGDSRGMLNIWDLNGGLLNSINAHSSAVSGLEYSPEGELIVTSSWDGTAKLWTFDGDLIETLSGHESGLTKAIFVYGGEIIATSSLDKTVRFWDKSGQLLSTVEYDDWISDIRFDPITESLAVAVGNGTAIIESYNIEFLAERGCELLSEHIKNPATPLEEQALCQP